MVKHHRTEFLKDGRKCPKTLEEKRALEEEIEQQKEKAKIAA